MSEDHTKKTVMPDIVRHLLDTVPVSPLSPGIINHNQPEWLVELNRRGERIAELKENIRQAKNCVEMVAANPRWTKIVKIYSGLALEVLKGAEK